MFQPSLIPDRSVEPLAAAVCRVLGEVGVLCQNAEILQALEAAGARVDHATQMATFPERLVTDFVDGLRRSASGPDGVPPLPPHTAFYRPGLPGLGTQVAQFFYDYERTEHRSGNRGDLIALTKFGDVLDGGRSVGHALAMTDVPAPIEPLEAALVLAEYARTPDAAFAWSVDQVDYLIEMGQALGLENWFHWGAICFAHPLRMDKPVADKFVRRCREGVATGLTAMPVAGVTTPVTLEGFIVVSTAEHIATWLAARALNPEVSLTGSVWAGSVDMRTGRTSYCAFDAMIYGFAACEFMRKWTGMRLFVGGGEYCDAKLPGLYAALEKAHKSMTIAAWQGHHGGPGGGLLDEGKTLSPVQLLLDREFAAGSQQYARGTELSLGDIGMETILEVGVGVRANYLQSEHTLRHFRDSLWLPALIDRSGWNGCEHEAQALAKAQRLVNDLTAQYAKPEGREEQLIAMRAVVERARRRLC